MMELESADDPHLRYSLLNKLASMARYQRTVLKASGGNVQRLNARLSYYKREMQKLEHVLNVTEPKIDAKEAGLRTDGDPF